MSSTGDVDAKQRSDEPLPAVVRLPVAGLAFTVGLFFLIAGVHDLQWVLSQSYVSQPASALLRAFVLAAFGSTVALGALAYAFGRLD